MSIDVIAIYPFVAHPSRRKWERYNDMMRDANEENKYELIRDDDGDYYIYFAKNDKEHRKKLIGKLDEKSTLKIRKLCKTNKYSVEWDSNYYQDFKFSDRSTESSGRAGGSFHLHVISWTCPHCGHSHDDETNACGFCGMVRPKGEIETWDCEICNQKGNIHPFCSNCGSPKGAKKESDIREYDEWICPACGTKNKTHYFCGECGARKGTSKSATASIKTSQNNKNQTHDYYSEEERIRQEEYEESARNWAIQDALGQDEYNPDADINALPKNDDW